MTDELRSRAWGTDVLFMGGGGGRGPATAARARIADLEQRWSRFLPDSEISRINAAAGRAVTASDETVRMVTLARKAWELTGGLFDATVLGDVLRAGYDRSFDDVAAAPHNGTSTLGVGCRDIELRGNEISLPAGTGFDPGGIGKGLAADIVAIETVGEGADGVCVNIGGDVRVIGDAPDDESWTIAIEHPWSHEPLTIVSVADGAVATSTTLRRTWRVGGETRHHLIDPSTGLPSDTDINLASVVAAQGWMAETLAKATLLRGPAHSFELVEAMAAQALTVDDDGRVRTTAGFHAFVASGELAAQIQRGPIVDANAQPALRAG
jgi:thiamine biosynthesis lipoprotein